MIRELAGEGSPNRRGHAIDVTAELLVLRDAACEYLSSHDHVVSGLAELGLVVGLAGHTGVDGGEQRVDVRDQLVGDRIGGQLGNHGVDQLAEGDTVGIKIGFGLGNLLVVLGGLAQGVVDEEPDVLPPGGQERFLGIRVHRAERLGQRHRVCIESLDCADDLRILQITLVLHCGIQRISRQPNVI